MAMQIDWAIDRDTWRAFLARCSNATFYHDPGWYEARREALSLRLVTPHFRFGDGAEALLPLAVRRTYRGLVNCAYSGLETGYGGLVAPVPLLPHHRMAAYEAVRRRYPDLVVTGSPHEAYDNGPSGATCEHDLTQVLAVLPPDAQARAMSTMRARHLKKAAKEGLSLQVVTPPQAADVTTFYPLYTAHAATWAYTRWLRDAAYFRALCQHAGDKLVLFIARLGDEPVGFHLIGLGTGPVIQLHLATSAEGDRLNAGTWLIAESLAWCHAQGHTRFDFLPSGRLEGVRAYKGSFGAELRPFSVVSYEGWLSPALAALRQWPQRFRHAPQM